MNRPHKVDQTIFVGDAKKPGNCFAACVASALGLQLEDVPHFLDWGETHYGDDRMKGSHWHAMFLGFVAGRGVWPEMLEAIADADPDDVVFVSGPSPRGVPHQVLYREGRLWHDPHPSRAGVLSVAEDDIWVLRPCGPHNHEPTPMETP